MKKGCRIVCPNACRNCGITPCADRMADEDKEQVTVATTELSAFFAGNRASGSIAPSPYEDISNVKEAEALKHCGMADPILCRHCHETTCAVRKAPRTF